MQMQLDKNNTPIPPAADDYRPVKRRYLARDIFQGTNEVLIEHDGDEYRLRITRKGRLILTK